ncbi:hypothetical protein GUITHDRAFT_121191 [Guillardia theta CCMP2712]|uniref:Uncharacterized protein n=1 Tax=Guillardia theta (strain CCMP2712) TaxID=905079 RepID=L1I9Q0_GUITC|nr:hypothetical protein GUITHDRAFT_121191 [Guillardia theta CCMP2712]EKX32634.1 hypothetical protein GUITHDRAFT_121191 [Guillardia theta CCMP2712]|eukprot:XP_005819614.1 hypothetical protein GUITHDRAFT_121191 [Guillardia theta CCMP2712]
MAAIALMVVMACWEAAGAIEILSPRPRELFSSLPVSPPLLLSPAMTRTAGADLDPDVRGGEAKLGLGINGRHLYDIPASSLIETSCGDFKEGSNEIAVYFMRRDQEAPQVFQFNITIRLDADQNEMIFYIPPKDSAHPRILHHLVTPRQQRPDDVQRCYSKTCSAQA